MSIRRSFLIVETVWAFVVAACANGSGHGEDSAVGTVQIALSAATAHDVATVHFKVLSATKTCADSPIAEVTATLEAEALPSSLAPPDAGEHHFADAFFTLAPGDYRACATPLKSDGSPSNECAAAETVASVVGGATSEVLIVSQCTGDDNGALDVVAALNNPPHIDNVTISPSKFITSCE